MRRSTHEVVVEINAVEGEEGDDAFREAYSPTPARRPRRISRERSPERLSVQPPTPRARRISRESNPDRAQSPELAPPSPRSGQHFEEVRVTRMRMKMRMRMLLMLVVVVVVVI